MKNLALFLFFTCSSVIAFGQYINGQLIDNQGNAMPFANVYVKESTYGVSTDGSGKFFLELAQGDHVIVFSFVGYETIEELIEMGNEPIKLIVTLKQSATLLNDVEIVADTRDRAKQIMKQVRDKRSYYLGQVENYECKTYLKTSLEKELIKPKKSDTLKLINDSLNEGKTDKNDDLKNYFKKEKLNLIESVSQTYFERPGKYKEKIKAYHDYAEQKGDGDGRDVSISYDFEERGIAPSSFVAVNSYLLYQDVSSVELNFYKKHINYPAVCNKPLLSPLASGSQLSYIYDFGGAFYEDGKKIYRIDFRPILKTEALFSGTLFIEDSSWALKTIDVKINSAAMMMCKEFRIIQNYEEVDSAIYLPTRREITYTIKDGRYEILGNTRVNHSGYKVNQEFPPRFFNNEIKEYEVDAFDKDSTYWVNERPITLKDTELEFIHESDSMSKYYVSDEYFAKIDSSFNKINGWTPLVGIGHRNRRLGTEWYISGLMEQINPFGIGGYRHKLPAYINKDFDNGLGIESKGFVDYGFTNQDVKGELEVGLTYNPKKFMKTAIRAGDTYEMINDYASIEQTFSRSNYIRSRSYGITQRLEVLNGLYAELAFDYTDQDPIDNLQLAEWSNYLFGSLNNPVDFTSYKKSEIKLELLYRINQKYVFKKGRKLIIGSNYPEVTFTYRKGIPNILGSEVDFDYVELGASDELNIGRYGKSRWQIKGGTYLNKKNLRVLEYKYFRGSDRYFFSDPVTSFQLLGPTKSTPNEYLSANYIHHFQGTLLNKIPLVNKLKLEIAAGTGVLLIPDDSFAHIELFAGIERVFRIKEQLFRVGAYAVGADNTVDAADLTYKFGISFFNPFTKSWDY
ncbi:MAG: carboxypeptidase-like regulatory domain-containing protein [Flavobacteriales bacterium]|nr:carboxypeptidase-like regulatory domain-containing protein [Flavobacteriales bacterium]